MNTVHIPEPPALPPAAHALRRWLAARDITQGDLASAVRACARERWGIENNACQASTIGRLCAGKARPLLLTAMALQEVTKGEVKATEWLLPVSQPLAAE